MVNTNTGRQISWRAALSEDERARIRASDGAARQQARERKRKAENMSNDTDSRVLEDTDEQLAFHPLSDAVFDEIYTLSSSALSNAAMSEVVCCCCDALVPVSVSKRSNLGRNVQVLRSMHECLKPPDDLFVRFVEEYDVSDIDDRLQGLLLPRRGVMKDQKNSVVLVLCLKCSASLMRKQESSPKFAIVNGFFMGT